MLMKEDMQECPGSLDYIRVHQAYALFFLKAMRFSVVGYLLKIPHSRFCLFFIIVHASFHQGVDRHGSLSDVCGIAGVAA